MYVLTIDQRGSTGDVDRVPGLLDELGALSPPDVLNVRSATSPGRRGRCRRGRGDRAACPAQRPLVRRDRRRGSEPAAAGQPAGRLGPAFVAARAAVDRAKAAAAHVPLAVVAGVGREAAAHQGAGTGQTARAGRRGRVGRAGGVLACANAEAVLRLIGRLVQDRTAAQWKVVDVLRSVRQGTHGTHGSQKIAAQKLGITEQSVSRAVLRSGWQEEWAARPAAELLLTLAHVPKRGPKHLTRRSERPLDHAGPAHRRIRRLAGHCLGVPPRPHH